MAGTARSAFAFVPAPPASTTPPRPLDLPDLSQVVVGARSHRDQRRPADPSFTADELARAAAAAVASEVAERDRAWRSSLDERTARALSAIGEALSEARASHRLVLDALAAEVASLAIAAFRGLIAPALAEVGAARLTQLVTELLRSLPERPALEILCHPADRDAVDAACRAVAAEGSIAAAIAEDPRLDPGRIVARWGDSWAELDTPGLLSRLETGIRDAVALSRLLHIPGPAEPAADRIEGDPK